MFAYIIISGGKKYARFRGSKYEGKMSTFVIKITLKVNVKTVQSDLCHLQSVRWDSFLLYKYKVIVCQMGMTEEMMNDTLDDLLTESGDEEEQDAIVNQVHFMMLAPLEPTSYQQYLM